MTTEIDWSKAETPYDFHITFYGNGNAHFYREEQDRFVTHGEYYIQKCDLKAIGAVVTKRPGWTGEDLPPVGTVCEVVKLAGHLPDTLRGWESGDSVECIAHFEVQGKHLSAVFFNKRLYAFSTLRRDCYRPLRTPEQIAADQAIDALCEFARGVAGGNDFHRAFWERAYKAGLRAPK